jgi:hypothetical protein
MEIGCEAQATRVPTRTARADFMALPEQVLQPQAAQLIPRGGCPASVLQQE